MSFRGSRAAGGSSDYDKAPIDNGTGIGSRGSRVASLVCRSTPTCERRDQCIPRRGACQLRSRRRCRAVLSGASWLPAKMTDMVTHFPPQTYSSSFFLNALDEDEAPGNIRSRKIRAVEKERNRHQSQTTSSSSNLLDCFITKFLSTSGSDRGGGGSDSSESNGVRRDLFRVVGNCGSKESNEPSDRTDVDGASRDWSNKSASSETIGAGFKRWRKAVVNGNSNLNGKRPSPSSVLPKSQQQTPDKCKDEEMSLLKFLAINALDLSAPASDVLLKSRSSNWFQLSGHPDSLAPAGPGTVWKKLSGCPSDTERLVYEQLSQDPLLRDIIPRYYRRVEYQGEKFIELQDLLHGFRDPHVIDIKMGTRTFLESEVQKTIARTDLYQKMIAIDPSSPTSEERLIGAVTKLRYMQFRELQSSSCEYGFRIEAMKCRGSPPVTDLKKMKSRNDVINTLDLFLNGRHDVKQKLLDRLCEIRNRIEQSNYFTQHEVIGSSIFMIYDDTKVGAWIIDFAKTNRVPDGMVLDHRKPWVQGNHEEGFLFGLDKLILMLEKTPTSSQLS